MTVGSIDKNDLYENKMIAAYDVMRKNGDFKNAQKVKDIYQKYKNQFKSLSFVGHFSAGKSSLINALLGDDILPESPIPTSANIVQITSGKGNVKVFFNSKEPEEYSEPYDIEMIKDYCMRKGTISRIDISTSQSIIPEKWAFFDTPGIDAADDADRLITESSLHLVDMFVYVMDYNHVQSEANMYFLQHIQAMGIPFYIIINQVDKHNDAEIAFSTFRKIVKQTFEQWNIDPQFIYYTSMIKPEIAHNQFVEVKQRLFDLMRVCNDNSKTIERAFAQVVEEHTIFLQAEYEQKKEAIGEIQTVLDQPFDKVQNDLKYLQQEPEWVYDSFQRALKTSLKNAYVMPAILRDKAELFLESQQNGFKVGIFSSKKKTNVEIQKRTDNFLTDLNKTIQTTIQWKVRDKFQILLSDNDIHDADLREKVNQIELEYTENDLLEQVKPGAKVNGNYMLRYTNDVETDIKQQFKALMQPILNTVLETVKTRVDEKLKPLQKEKEKLEAVLKQRQSLDALTNKFNEKQKQLHGALEATEITEAQQALIENNEIDEHEMPPQIKTVGEKESSLPKIELQDEQMVTSTTSVSETVQSLGKTTDIIWSLPGFQSFVKELTHKQSKLQNRNVTIALFGAFSAGKSSFANALLGKNVLPSSPQPTTAVINRILPVSETNPHGTVLVQYKDTETLYQDIQDILSDYTPETDTLDELISWIKNNQLQDVTDLSDIYRSYLRAILSGYPIARSNFGKQITLTMVELDDYLTVESVSCYLERVDIYYQCALTDQSITLVDTPGADSVNRRHTNVAFNYIKYADAIFYVTYYNHALSRADKTFLTQLGRVKDVFQLDKMFFIINAIDLAQNEADLKLVKHYVKDQLLELGIRFPAIFPLSSKYALLSKQEGTSLPEGIRHFEEAFYEFIQKDLPALSIQSAFHDIKRVYKAVQTYLENVELNQEERSAKQQAIYQEQASFHEFIQRQNIDVMEKQFVQKVEKQLYYVEDRIKIGFHDMFKEAYNPTSITESGKAGQKQLRRSLHGLLEDVSFELVQEMQAVSLRVEAFMQTLLNDYYEGVVHYTESNSSTFLLPKLENTSFEAPTFERAFDDLNSRMFRHVFSMYNGTRNFFVKNEKEAFKEAMFTVLEPVIHDYVTTQKTILIDAYQHQLKNAVNTMKSDLINQVAQHVENNLAMLSDTIDKEQIINKKLELEAILS